MGSRGLSSKSLSSVQSRLKSAKGSFGIPEHYRKMSETELVNYLRDMNRLQRDEMYDLGLNPYNDLQQLVHNLNMHEKPTVLGDSDFDSQIKENALGDTLLYRGVSSDVAVQSTMFADTTYIGDGIHGDGLYFSTKYDTAVSYAGSMSRVMTAFIDKSLAKPIEEQALRTAFNNESAPVRQAFLYNADMNSAIAKYALYKGYNVIHVPGGNLGYSYRRKNGSGEDYYVPLTRSILVMREHTKRGG